MSLDKFFLDYRKTALQSDEILKTIIIPRLNQNLFLELINSVRDSIKISRVFVLHIAYV